MEILMLNKFSSKSLQSQARGHTQDLKAGLALFCYKGEDGEHIRLCGPDGLGHSYSPLLCSLTVATDES